MFETETDSPASHPEVGYKVPILDLSVWVEKVWLPAPGMDSNNLHSSCPADGTCLPLGTPHEQKGEQGMADKDLPARRMVQQIFFEFYT